MTKQPDWLTREWHSLGQVRDYVKNHTQEKVHSFNGFELVTDKYRYGLAFGQLRRSKLK